MDKEKWTARQHGQLFRHRAAENGRWLAIASTSGLSQIISYKGNTRADLPLMEDGILTGEIEALQHQTLFQREGWLFGPVCLIGTIILMILALRDAFIKRRQRKTSETTSMPESPDAISPDQTAQA